MPRPRVPRRLWTIGWRRLATLAWLLVAASAGPAGAVDRPAAESPSRWGQFMGPRGDGSIVGTGLFSESRTPRLRALWRRRIGSGYSDLVLDGEQLYTMVSDGSEDSLVALQPDTGDLLWRYRIGPVYRGHGGSSDGPVSTPLVDGERIVALGPRGSLFAVDRESGAELWRRDLVADYGAESPPWGFASSPIAVAGRIVVGVGGPEAALCAFEAATGEGAWCSGSGPVFYQSPTLVELAGRSQIVANTDDQIFAVDPVAGDLLWTRPHGEGKVSGIARLAWLNPSRFLISRRGYQGDFAAFDVIADSAQGGPGGSTFGLREVWSSEELGSTYQVPLTLAGFVYGYSGQFLTCLDGATGRRVWKSREPGRGRAILVDGRLVTWAVDGSLRVGRVSAEAGYREEARAQILDAGSYHLPAVGEGRLFVRNLQEVAAVEVSSVNLEGGSGEPLTPVGETAGSSAGRVSELDRFLGRLAAAADKAAFLDAFFASRDRMPWIEEPDRVHFLYRGEGQEVAVAGTMAPWGEAMQRAPGTDLFYASYEIDPAARWQYRFVVDFDREMADPLNPERTMGRRGEVSELRMPAWREPAFLSEPPRKSGGRLEEVVLADGAGEVESAGEAAEGASTERTVSVYLPHGYDETEVDHPLLVVTNAAEALELGTMVRALDYLMSGELPPAVVAFVPFRVGPFGIYGESAGAHRETIVHLLGEELVPALEARYRLLRHRGGRALIGAGSGAWAGLAAALRYPEVYGAAAVQGVDLRIHLRRDLYAALEAHASVQRLQPLRLRLEWSRYERGAPEDNADYPKEHAALVAALAAAGDRVEAAEIAGGPDWGTWRAGIPRLLRFLLPAG